MDYEAEVNEILAELKAKNEVLEVHTIEDGAKLVESFFNIELPKFLYGGKEA